MSTVNPIAGGSTAVSGTEAARQNAALDQQQFLTLLVAQLENQDPLNPVENQDFIAQLATFSSLEQLISINEGVGTLTDTLAAFNETADVAQLAAFSSLEQLASINEGVSALTSALTASDEDAA
ncbi:MAG: flagellar hook capping protein [Acidobacteriota bacterium]|jgi:flagellar basal-body rod modification protein FlgD|nr:flagellar hook capping protein [Acidobacteriota bacterium]